MSLPRRWWRRKLWPQALEASITYRQRPAGARQDAGGQAPAVPRDRAKDSNRRAVRNVERWGVANGARYMWIPTWRDPCPYDIATRDRCWREFCKRLPVELRKINYVPIYRGARGRLDGHWDQVPMEICWHPSKSGRGWHGHFITPWWLPIKAVKRAWKWGRVKVVPPPEGKGPWRPQRAANYVSRYIAHELKGGDLRGCEARGPRQHRYAKTHGFEPKVEQADFRYLATALADTYRRMGAPVDGYAYGLDGDFPALGVTLFFAPRGRAPPPERVKAESRAERGKP